jgi:cysteinyl-tRNA synthetase
MKVFNTLTKKLDEFLPINEGKVNLFVCGPTVYDYPHLGHGKTYTQFDLIVKYLRWRGYDVFYAQNITDIDDKIIKRAGERGITWDKLAREYEAIYMGDMAALHNTAVTKFARATDYIDQIVKQVKVLLDKGFAYKTGDGIYYEVSKFEGYGKLSKRTELKEEDAISRIDEGTEKRGWNDFCVWKNSKPEEPFWETELGKGRPGWHIEDTAITEALFGPQYDIHGGAVDLIFPHHEAEIAQMEAASGKEPLVRYWLHTGFLNINSEKMSKSKGNFTTIRQALERYNYRVLRYLFVSSHYRSSLDFTESVLEKSKNSLKRLEDYLSNIDKSLDDPGEKAAVDGLRVKVISAMDNDFDTPTAFAAIYEFVRDRNTKGKSGKYAYEFMSDINDFFGIFDLEEESVSSEVIKLAEERKKARDGKNWQESDRLRDEIEKMGYMVEDISNGYKIKKL